MRDMRSMRDIRSMRGIRDTRCIRYRYTEMSTAICEDIYDTEFAFNSLQVSDRYED